MNPIEQKMELQTSEGLGVPPTLLEILYKQFITDDQRERLGSTRDPLSSSLLRIYAQLLNIEMGKSGNVSTNRISFP